MFDELSASFEDAVKSLRGENKISEDNVDVALKQVRRALLEADVSLSVVKQFVEEVREKAIGAEVVRGVKPGQKFVEIVHQELVDVMGGINAPLSESTEKPSVILMAGLQGAGKTTATAKLGLHLKEKGVKALMVAADVYRPAAIDQLTTLGKQIDVEVFSLGKELKPEEIAAAGLAKAKEEGFESLIVDTAGRLQIDEAMMDEMVRIRSAVNPNEVLLVVDSMIGQEAADLTRAFHEKVGITGAVLTKLDGDSRGGAALSLRECTGKPIKFIGTGESVKNFDIFHPERMASRILGMGDVVSLVEKAEKAFDKDVALSSVERLKSGIFTFQDYKDQISQIKKLGPLSNVMSMIPGFSKLKNTDIDENQFKWTEAIIDSMTKQEREKPDIINASRRKRIALGSGRTIQDVNRLMKQFNQMKIMIKKMKNKKSMNLPFNFG